MRSVPFQERNPQSSSYPHNAIEVCQLMLLFCLIMEAAEYFPEHCQYLSERCQLQSKLVLELFKSQIIPNTTP